jgi:nucleotide-binding universal stress UspA family protein
MVSAFKNILIPVDLTINTEVSIKKALELTDNDSIIHLLYVDNNGLSGSFIALKNYFTDPGGLMRKQEIKRKLNQWKAAIGDSHKNLKVSTWIIESGSVQKTIEDVSMRLDIDLIVIGKNANHPWLPILNTVVPSALVKKTGIAVLTVTPGSMSSRLRKVVIPIIGNESIRLKMDMIFNLCKKFRLNIHLLTFTNRKNDGTDLNVSSFLQAYQSLNFNNHCHLEYAVLYGNNKAKAIWKYSEKVQADVLIVHPGSETKLGWPNKNISDMLPAKSRMYVLAV